MSLVCRHIPGTQNGAADALSRNALSSFQRLMPGARGQRGTNALTRHPAGVPSAGFTRLDQHRLDYNVQALFLKGLADNTHKVYRSGQNSYLSFCAKAGLQGVPTQEAVLCKFVAQLAVEGLRHTTIKSYMALTYRIWAW